MTIKVGDQLPDAKFTVMGPDGPHAKTTAEVFSGKKVVLFAVPGAFTPTCSEQHLPGFVGNAGRHSGQGRRHHRLHGGERRVRAQRMVQGTRGRRRS